MTEKVIKVRFAWGVIQKSVGLIGKQKPENILIKTRFGVHTFGLKFPIDVIILDRENRIVKLKESLQPNKVYFWNIKHDTVVESKVNTINKLKLKAGQVVKLEIE